VAEFNDHAPAAALADYDHALQIDPNDEHAYNNRGLVLQARGDLEGAVADFSQAIQIDPTFSQAQRNRAWAEWHSGDVWGAVTDLF
jgi:lipoprotein NlpI